MKVPTHSEVSDCHIGSLLLMFNSTLDHTVHKPELLVTLSAVWPRHSCEIPVCVAFVTPGTYTERR